MSVLRAVNIGEADSSELLEKQVRLSSGAVCADMCERQDISLNLTEVIREHFLVND